MKLSVLTLVRNRNRYLPGLVEALSRQRVPPHELVVARAGGEDPRAALRGAPFPVRVLEIEAPDERIPYAPARNAAARAATSEGVLFLDADCLPAVTSLAAFGDALAQDDALCIGDVLYLPPGADRQADGSVPDDAALREAARPHPRRVQAPREGIAESTRYSCVWGLCFAIRRATLFRLGGFDEGYRGYAGEDTDLAFTARAAGLPLHLVADADVFHRHHDVFEPPLQQFEATLANARHFHDRHGWWPMSGWLAHFRDLGLVEWSPGADEVRVLRLPTPDEVEAARYHTAAAFRQH